MTASYDLALCSSFCSVEKNWNFWYMRSILGGLGSSIVKPVDITNKTHSVHH